MTPTPAPTSPGPGWLLLLIAFAAVAATGYGLSCWWFPFRRCWCCKGRGVHRRDDGQVMRPCRWCTNTGRRLRLGRRLFNRLVHARRDTTRTR